MESSSTCTRLEQLKCRGSLSVIEDGIRKTASEFALSGMVDTIEEIYLVADLDRFERADLFCFADRIASISRQTYLSYNSLLGNEIRFTTNTINRVSLSLCDISIRIFYSGKGSEHAKVYLRGAILSNQERAEYASKDGEIKITTWASLDLLHKEINLPHHESVIDLTPCKLSSGINYPLRCHRGGEGSFYTYELPHGPYILQDIHVTTPYSYTVEFNIGALTYSNYIKSRPFTDKDPTCKISPSKYHYIGGDRWCVKLYKMPFSTMKVTITEMYGRLMKEPPMVCANLVRADRINDMEEEFVELEDGITVKYSQGFLKIHKIETLEERQAREPRGEDW